MLSVLQKIITSWLYGNEVKRIINKNLVIITNVIIVTSMQDPCISMNSNQLNWLTVLIFLMDKPKQNSLQIKLNCFERRNVTLKFKMV